VETASVAEVLVVEAWLGRRPLAAVLLWMQRLSRLDLDLSWVDLFLVLRSR
jgi:hypothetical protein